MFDKYKARVRRGAKARYKIKQLGMPRLTVHKTPVHMYAQLIIDEATGSRVVASASTLHKSHRAQMTGTKIDKAALVGKLIAEAATAAGYVKVAFDRSGNKYHGRVKALAEAAREAGLSF